MTVYFPDLSSYEGGVSLQPGTPAIVAKATEGTYYKDPYYTGFKSMADVMHITFSGYHFLVTFEDPASQAHAYYNFAGTTPCMLDVETEGTSKPSVADCLIFITTLQSLGGRCWGVYFPEWYWGQVGGDLGSLERAGAVLVSSDYTAYTDTGPGWNSYGGATPRIWQYTNSQNYAGMPCDFNAFRGTAGELTALILGNDMTPEEHNWLINLYAGEFTGGPSCGRKGVDDKNSTVAKLDYLMNAVDKLTAPPAIDVNTLAAAIAPLLTPGATPDAVASAVVAHLATQFAK